MGMRACMHVRARACVCVGGWVAVGDVAFYAVARSKSGLEIARTRARIYVTKQIKTRECTNER
jgi:hypothetical protein